MVDVKKNSNITIPSGVIQDPTISAIPKEKIRYTSKEQPKVDMYKPTYRPLVEQEEKSIEETPFVGLGINKETGKLFVGGYEIDANNESALVSLYRKQKFKTVEQKPIPEGYRPMTNSEIVGLHKIITDPEHTTLDEIKDVGRVGSQIIGDATARALYTGGANLIRAEKVEKIIKDTAMQNITDALLGRNEELKRRQLLTAEKIKKISEESKIGRPPKWGTQVSEAIRKTQTIGARIADLRPETKAGKTSLAMEGIGSAFGSIPFYISGPGGMGVLAYDQLENIRESAEDKILNLPQEYLDKNETYTSLIKRGLSPEDAKKTMSIDAGQEAVMYGIVPVATEIGVGGVVLKKTLGNLGKIFGKNKLASDLSRVGTQKQGVKGKLKNVAEILGFATGGAAFETAQEMLENASINKGVNNILGENKFSYLEDFENTAWGAAPAGFLFGGIAGGAKTLAKGRGLTTPEEKLSEQKIEQAKELPKKKLYEQTKAYKSAEVAIEEFKSIPDFQKIEGMQQSRAMAPYVKIYSDFLNPEIDRTLKGLMEKEVTDEEVRSRLKEAQSVANKKFESAILNMGKRGAEQEIIQKYKTPQVTPIEKITTPVEEKQIEEIKVEKEPEKIIEPIKETQDFVQERSARQTAASGLLDRIKSGKISQDDALNIAIKNEGGVYSSIKDLTSKNIKKSRVLRSQRFVQTLNNIIGSADIIANKNIHKLSEKEIQNMLMPKEQIKTPVDKKAAKDAVEKISKFWKETSRKEPEYQQAWREFQSQPEGTVVGSLYKAFQKNLSSLGGFVKSDIPNFKEVNRHRKVNAFDMATKEVLSAMEGVTVETMELGQIEKLKNLNNIVLETLNEFIDTAKKEGVIDGYRDIEKTSGNLQATTTERIKSGERPIKESELERESKESLKRVGTSIPGIQSRFKREIPQSLGKLASWQEKAVYNFLDFLETNEIGKQIFDFVQKGKLDIKFDPELSGENMARIRSEIRENVIKDIIYLSINTDKLPSNTMHEYCHFLLERFLTRGEYKMMARLAKGKYYDRLVSALGADNPAIKAINEQAYEAPAYFMEAVLTGKIKLDEKTKIEKIIAYIKDIIDKIRSKYKTEYLDPNELIKSIRLGKVLERGMINEKETIKNLALMSEETLKEDGGWIDSIKLKDLEKKDFKSYGVTEEDVINLAKEFYKDTPFSRTAETNDRVMSSVLYDTNVASDEEFKKTLGRIEEARLKAKKTYESAVKKSFIAGQSFNYAALNNKGVKNAFNLISTIDQTRSYNIYDLYETIRPILNAKEEDVRELLLGRSSNKTLIEALDTAKEKIINISTSAGVDPVQYLDALRKPEGKMAKTAIKKFIAYGIFDSTNRYFSRALQSALDGQQINIDMSGFRDGRTPFPDFEITENTGLFGEGNRSQMFRDYVAIKLSLPVSKESNSWLDTARMAAYVDELGLKMSSFAINILGAMPSLQAFATKEAGLINGTAHLFNAFSTSEAWSGLFNNRKAIKKIEDRISRGNYTQQQKELFKALLVAEKDGSLGVQSAVFEGISALADDSTVNKIARNITEKALVFSSKPEVIVRRVAFIMGYNIAKEKGLTRAEAEENGRKFINEALGNYSKWNRPEIFNNKFAALIAMFQQQPWHAARTWYHLGKTAKQTGNYNDIMAFATYTSGLMLLGGAFMIPFFSEFSHLYDIVGQNIFNKPTNLRKQMNDSLGFWSVGGAIAGQAGLSSSFKSEFFPFIRLIARDADLDNVDAKDMFGPFGTFVDRLLKRIDRPFEKETWQQDGMGAMRGLLSGLDIMETGRVVGRGGETVISVKDPITSGLIRMTGARPREQLVEEEEFNAIYRTKAFSENIKTDYADRISKALHDGDRDKAKQLIMEAHDSGIYITKRMIESRLQKHIVSKKMRLIKSLPAEYRKEFLED